MSINLEFPYSDVLVPAIQELFVVNQDDLTQLGRRRNTFEAAHQFPLVNGFVMTGTGLAKNAIFRSLFPSSVDWGTADDVTIEFNNMSLADARVNPKDIDELRESLKPTNLVTNREIWAHPGMQDIVHLLKESRPIDLARFAAHVTKQLSSDQDLYEFMAGNNMIEEDTATIRSARTMTADEVDKLTFGDLTNVFSRLINVPTDVVKSFKNLEFASLRDLMGDSEALASHDVIASPYEISKNDIMSRHSSLPKYWKDYFEAGNRAAAYPVVVRVGSQVIEARDAKIDALNEFAYFSLCLLQAAHPNMDRNYEFAYTRMMTYKLGFLIDSTEKCEMVLGHNKIATTNAAHLGWFLKAAARPELMSCCLYTSAISFLKSGHHATAANLDNTLLRVAGAVNRPITLEQARDMIPSAVYHGPHCASMRVMYAYLLWKNARENVTGAIALRLHPSPPTIVAFTNLELFVESLRGARYFEIMDRQNEYDAFKAAMKEIRSVMWYTCPYSDYLYGESRPDPTHAKEVASRLAGYAVALDVVMPNSSLRLSPALRKMAAQVGVNQIASQLLVESYVAGFRRYFRYFTETKLRGSVVKSGAGQIAFE